MWIVDNGPDALAVFDEQFNAGVDLIAEEKVQMRRELSAMIARSPFGQGGAWPVVETVQRRCLCGWRRSSASSA
ncbi:N5-carboxyaminoimidazole ribonucleotide synthase [Mycobacteroides abscessus subsp. abscessus]|nr:N5-carboxyaminoimidazole ribonucleotide synthase [Mycobacteroides abscessus subsp. abscessus]